MAAIQCKICGGFIELTGGQALTECRYCGNQVTLPQVTDENHAAAFNRGNHFRRIGEFDKALAVYERIIQEDEGNAEAHWCSALCRFGIEYVKDPTTGEYLPTCHRASYDSFLEDVDYLAALAHADDAARAHYQRDAEKIAQVQRGILAVSQTEKPFDVFLCYKETDESGQRTRDSQLAQDVYYQLTDQSMRVFFARITLEDKPGTQFEPYIFAALNTAKVMVVIGTRPEHLSATWVRNEWSRYLAIMKRDRSRLLIPCYRDMDPYDMPEQLSILQGYDMSRIGFIQDLVRGIRKVVGVEKSAAPTQQAAPAPTAAPAAPATEPLLRRVALFLEDGDWQSADEYCERVLDTDPENAQAYLGKLMAALHVTRQEKLKDQAQPFDGNPNYVKALRFADDALAEELRGAVEHINDRNEEAAYREAEQLLMGAQTEQDFINARRMFEKLAGYRDAAARAQECETTRLDWLYRQAERAMAQAQTASAYAKAGRLFADLGDWRDADEKAAACQRTSRETMDNEEAERQRREAASRKARQDAERRRKRNIGISTAVIAFLTAVVLLVTQVIIPNGKYNDAVQLMEAGRYEEAIAAFDELDGYRDSVAQIEACNIANMDGKYDAAVAMMSAGKYEEAIEAFEALDGYRDSVTQIESCNTGIYQREMDGKYDVAVALMSAGKYEEAIKAFEALNGYKDSAAQIKACNAAIMDPKYDAAVALMSAGKYEEAIKAFEALNGYKDSVAQIEACNYAWAEKKLADGNTALAAMRFGASGDYKDASARSRELWAQVAERHTIAAGDDHTVGLRADGTVVAVGYNLYGQCNVTDWQLKQVPRPTLTE